MTKSYTPNCLYSNQSLLVAVPAAFFRIVFHRGMPHLKAILPTAATSEAADFGKIRRAIELGTTWRVKGT